MCTVHIPRKSTTEHRMHAFSTNIDVYMKKRKKVHAFNTNLKSNMCVRMVQTQNAKKHTSIRSPVWGGTKKQARQNETWTSVTYVAPVLDQLELRKHAWSPRNNSMDLDQRVEVNLSHGRNDGPESGPDRTGPERDDMKSVPFVSEKSSASH